jgi:hypothetical protein
MDPSPGVWGGFGHCGGCGGGCGGGSGSGGQQKKRPDLSLVYAGAGCGTGVHTAACGAGSRDPSDNRAPPRLPASAKIIVDLTTTARLTTVCDIDIIPTCLNTFQLRDALVSSYVIRSNYSRNYRYG